MGLNHFQQFDNDNLNQGYGFDNAGQHMKDIGVYQGPNADILGQFQP